jgi:hypothetical protein
MHMTNHNNMIKRVKACVDNKDPRGDTKPKTRNPKKEALQEERYARIEQDNLLLLRRMHSILSAESQFNNLTRFGPRSMNINNRRKELERIAEDNQVRPRRAPARCNGTAAHPLPPPPPVQHILKNLREVTPMFDAASLRESGLEQERQVMRMSVFATGRKGDPSKFRLIQPLGSTSRPSSAAAGSTMGRSGSGARTPGRPSTAASTMLAGSTFTGGLGLGATTAPAAGYPAPTGGLAALMPPGGGSGYGGFYNYPGGAGLQTTSVGSAGAPPSHPAAYPPYAGTSAYPSSNPYGNYALPPGLGLATSSGVLAGGSGVLAGGSLLGGASIGNVSNQGAGGAPMGGILVAGLQPSSSGVMYGRIAPMTAPVERILLPPVPAAPALQQEAAAAAPAAAAAAPADAGIAEEGSSRPTSARARPESAKSGRRVRPESGGARRPESARRTSPGLAAPAAEAFLAVEAAPALLAPRTVSSSTGSGLMASVSPGSSPRAVPVAAPLSPVAAPAQAPEVAAVAAVPSVDFVADILRSAEEAPVEEYDSFIQEDDAKGGDDWDKVHGQGQGSPRA